MCVCVRVRAPKGTESEKDGEGKGHNVPVIAQPGRKSPLMVNPLEGISQMPQQAGKHRSHRCENGDGGKDVTERQTDRQIEGWAG